MPEKDPEMPVGVYSGKGVGSSKRAILFSSNMFPNISRTGSPAFVGMLKGVT